MKHDGDIEVGNDRAWAYLVVSSEQQTETIEYQRRWVREVATSRGWRISETFEGVSSGRDGIRSLLSVLLAKLQAQPKSARPARILMTRLDRLGRGLGLEALAALAEIVRLGVVIHTRQDGDITIMRASDSILPLMRLVTGGIENEARRDKANDTYRRRRLAGRVVSNKRAYGLRVQNGQDVPHAAEAAVVRLAFELAANGYGYHAIGSRLQAVAPPKVYANGHSHVTEWTSDRIRKLLRTESYRTTIVDEALWARVRTLQGASRKREVSKHPWPLSGALRCECGRMLIGSIRGTPAQRVYRCSAVGVHGKHRTFGAIAVEKRFSELLETIAIDPRSIRQFASHVAQLSHRADAEIEAQKVSFEGEVERIKLEHRRSWKLNSEGLLPDTHLARRLDELERLRLKAQEQLHILSIEQREAKIDGKLVESMTNAVREASGLWSNAEVGLKQAAARALSRALGGLCVLVDGTLFVGAPPKWNRFFRQSSTSI